MNLTQMDTIIELHGESVDIYRKSEGAADDYGDPAVTWTMQKAETAWIQDVRTIRMRGTQISETIAGVALDFDYVGYFKSDSGVARGDYVTDGSVKYDVQEVKTVKLLSSTSHVEAYMKLATE